ncbi:MAG: hypothetical protein PHG85_05740 [Candidatus Altiarchaeota archaeon]|nr:hypothetical protein [Candidatus Altiarchaeota archaeon]
MKKKYILIGLLAIIVIIGLSFLLHFQRTKVILSRNGNFVLDSWGNGAPSLTITAPAEYIMIKTGGIDFDVYYLTKLKSESYVGIYLGHNPDYPSFEGNISKVPGRIGNRTIVWRGWTENIGNQTITGRETIIPDFFPDKDTDYEGLLIHIFVEGHTKEEVDMLQSYCESIRINY